MGRRMAWEPPDESDYEQRGRSAALELGSALRRSGRSWDRWSPAERVEQIRRLVDAAGGFTAFPDAAVAAAGESDRAALAAAGRSVLIEPEGAIERRFAEALRDARHQIGLELQRHGLSLDEFDLGDVTAALPRAPRVVVDAEGGIERLPRMLEDVVREMAAATGDGASPEVAERMAAAYGKAFGRGLGVDPTPTAGDPPQGFDMPEIVVTGEPDMSREASEDVARARRDNPLLARAGHDAVPDFMRMLELFGRTIPWDELSADNRVIPLMDTVSDSDRVVARAVGEAARTLGFERVAVESATRERQLELRAARQVATFVPREAQTREYRETFDDVASRVIDAVEGQREGLTVDRARISAGRAGLDAVVIDWENLAGDIDHVTWTMQGTVEAIARGRGQSAEEARASGIAYASSFAESFGLGSSYSPVELGGGDVDTPPFAASGPGRLQSDDALLDELTELPELGDGDWESGFEI